MCYLSVFLNIGAIAKTEKNKQVLDKLQVERERGITVKAQTASLFYSHHGQQFLLNLIDTPVRTWFLSVFTVCFFLVFTISLPCATVTCLTVVWGVFFFADSPSTFPRLIFLNLHLVSVHWLKTLNINGSQRFRTLSFFRVTWTSAMKYLDQFLHVKVSFWSSMLTRYRSSFFFFFLNSVVPEFLLFVCTHAAAVGNILCVCVCFLREFKHRQWPTSTWLLKLSWQSSLSLTR